MIIGSVFVWFSWMRIEVEWGSFNVWGLSMMRWKDFIGRELPRG